MDIHFHVEMASLRFERLQVDCSGLNFTRVPHFGSNEINEIEIHTLKLSKNMITTIYLLYKAKHQRCPAYITDMFQEVNAVHSRTTRNAVQRNMYPITFAKLEALNKTFKHASTRSWNMLPTYIREAPSVHSFKKLYCDNYFSNRQITE